MIIAKSICGSLFYLIFNKYFLNTTYVPDIVHLLGSLCSRTFPIYAIMDIPKILESNSLGTPNVV